MADTGLRLLWTDDHSEERFRYEAHLIRKQGWDLTWGHNVHEAARLLSQQPFDALIIDQLLPYQRPDIKTVWGGCLLLRWLRGTYPPKKAPLVAVSPEHDIQQLQPLTVNSQIRVIILSDFYDDDVLSEMRNASDLDQNLVIYSKSINEVELFAFLKRAKPEATP